MATTITVTAQQRDPTADREISVTRFSLGMGNGNGMQLTIGECFIQFRSDAERYVFFDAMRQLGFLSGDWGE